MHPNKTKIYSTRTSRRRVGGGQKARKLTQSLSSLSDKQRMNLAIDSWTEATDGGSPVVITLHDT